MITDDDMVVCSCANVTMKDLKAVIKNGDRSIEEVQTITKLGTGCGKCTDGDSVKLLINELVKENK